MKYLIKTATEHINRCKFASRFDVDSFFRVCLLAVASVRIHSKTFWLSYLNPIQELLDKGLTFDQIHERIPFMPMKFKRTALYYLQEHKYELWDAMLSMKYDEFHDHLCKTVPGLGPVKAGFIVQMCYGKLGCIDTVNLKRFGLKKTSAVPHIYREQLKLTGENSQRMWFAWCEAVADRGNEVRDKLCWSAYGLSEAHALFVEQGSFDPQIVAHTL